MNKVRCLLAFLFLTPNLPAQGPAAPDTGKPYDVQVVLHIVENRFLTPLFQEQLHRDIHHTLQLTLGKLARVKLTRTHRLLGAIETEGLGPVLNAWDEVSEVRTVFLLLEYEAGRYRLQTRQHDGLTGLASPEVRESLVSDRARLARTAVDLIRKDFSLVGAVSAIAGTEAMIAVHAGELETNLSPWIQPGRVFAVCRLTQKGSAVRSSILPWTYLEVLSGGVEKGKVRCRLWRRFASDDLQPAPGVIGYRCLLLPPSKGPVRLRFLKEESLDYWPGVVVHVKRPGDEKPVVFKSSDASGLVLDKTVFSNLMLVLLPRGDRALVIPVVPAAEQTVVIALREDLEAEERAALEDRVKQWERRLVANGQLVTQRLRDLNEQIRGSFELARQTAADASTDLEKEIAHLQGEREQIKLHAVKLKTKTPDLERGGKLLVHLEERLQEMRERAARYEHVFKEIKGARELGLIGLHEKAKLHEGLAEFDQAIHAYETLVKADPVQGKLVKDHLESLRKDWKIKSPAHEKARDFFLADWGKLDVLEMARTLTRAQVELGVLEKLGDRLTPLRIMKANEGHAEKIQEKLKALSRDRTEDSRAQEKIVRAAARDLADLESRVRALAGKKEKK